jgi:hypothetical protein
MKSAVSKSFLPPTATEIEIFHHKYVVLVTFDELVRYVTC